MGDDQPRDENCQLAQTSVGGAGGKGKNKFPGKGATGKEIAAFLERQGFVRTGKSKSGHQKYKHSDGRQTEVPIHGGAGIPTGTLNKIKNQSGFND